MRTSSSTTESAEHSAARTEADPSTPQFPEGAQWALLRRAILLDHALEPVATDLVEDLQLRTYRRIPEGTFLLQHETSGTQTLAEFQLRRGPVIAGKLDLHPITTEEPDFLHVQFASHGHDPFDHPEHFEPPITASIGSCTICHRDPGIHSVRTFSRTSIAPPSCASARAKARRTEGPSRPSGSASPTGCSAVSRTPSPERGPAQDRAAMKHASGGFASSHIAPGRGSRYDSRGMRSVIVARDPSGLRVEPGTSEPNEEVPCNRIHRAAAFS